MKRIQLLTAFFVLLFLLVFGLATPSRAQSWSGIIDPTRAVNWSNVGIPGGVPNRTTICATLNPGASASQISSAIQSCPSGQVVFLNAGTYNLNNGIDFGNKSNVTLRGAGADQTLLVFTSGTGCFGQNAAICIENGELNWAGGPTNSANWTAGYAQGTTTVTLSGTSNLKVGNYLILDQLNDTSSTVGSIYVCEATGSPCNTQEGGSAGRSNRAQQQLVKVTAISGNNVTITPGLYMPNWSSSHSPGAWWPSTVISNSGVENLSIDNTNSGVEHGVTMMNAYQCWVKGIRSLNSQRDHINLYITKNTVVRDSYFYGTQNAASQSYGVETFDGSDQLVENNIFQKVTTPVQMNDSQGLVIGYNFNIYDYYSASANWMIYGQSFHAAGDDYILMEGNQGNGFIADNIHGQAYFATGFRNWWLGWEVNKSAQTIPIQIYNLDRYFNMIGNVLGEPGYHSNYQVMCPSSTGSPETAIFTAGWSGNGGEGTPCDSETATSLLRWGNWDVVKAATQFNSAEVPTADANFPNSVPASQTLPSSFYLASKPAFWGSMPWPAIGPDVTGGNTSWGGHVYNNPANVCFATVMGGPTNGIGNALSFNANTCYGSETAGSGSGTPPAPPTNLSAVPH